MGHTAKSFPWTDVAEALLHFGGQTGFVCWSAPLAAPAALLKPYPVVLWRQRGLEAFWGTVRRGQAVLKYLLWVHPAVHHCCSLNFLDPSNLSHLSQATSAFLVFGWTWQSVLKKDPWLCQVRSKGSGTASLGKPPCLCLWKCSGPCLLLGLCIPHWIHPQVSKWAEAAGGVTHGHWLWGTDLTLLFPSPWPSPPHFSHLPWLLVQRFVWKFGTTQQTAVSNNDAQAFFFFNSLLLLNVLNIFKTSSMLLISWLRCIY